MTHQTVRLADIGDYLASEDDSAAEQAEQSQLRNERLSRFPYAAMLQVAFPELDFINRWCWLQFGPRDGECTQQQSKYRVCEKVMAHAHEGRWTDYWFTKTAYNYGFNEWYFVNSQDFDKFIRHVPDFNWGEHYPK